MPFSYDTIAPHYEHTIAPLERRFFQRLREVAFAALPANGRILELGAGTGLNFRFFEPAACGAALEPSTEMLKLAQRKQRPNRVSLVQGFAEKLPFRDQCFDSGVATLVMCSVQSPELVFKELLRVVKSNGTVVLLDHVRPNGLLGLAFDALNLITVPLMADHVNRRTAELAEKAGLRVIDIKSEGWGIINLITCMV